MENEYRHNPELDRLDRVAMRTVEEGALWRRDPSARRSPATRKDKDHGQD